VFSPDTTSIISVGCYLWGLLTAFHQTSRQRVTSQSRLGLAHLRLGLRLGLGRKGLVHIPERLTPFAIYWRLILFPRKVPIDLIFLEVRVLFVAVCIASGK